MRAGQALVRQAAVLAGRRPAQQPASQHATKSVAWWLAAASGRLAHLRFFFPVRRCVGTKKKRKNSWVPAMAPPATTPPHFVAAALGAAAELLSVVQQRRRFGAGALLVTCMAG